MSCVFINKNELLSSDAALKHGISNKITISAQKNLDSICPQLDLLHLFTLGSLKITSGYRSPELNRFVGGTEKSKHIDGLAVDVVSRFLPNDVVVFIGKAIDPSMTFVKEEDHLHISMKSSESSFVMAPVIAVIISLGILKKIRTFSQKIFK